MPTGVCSKPHEADLPHRVSLFDMHMKYADVVGLEEIVRHLQAVAVG